MPDSSTTAMTDSAAAKPKAGAAPTHPTSTPPSAGPLANATVRASSIRALAAGNCLRRHQRGHQRRRGDAIGHRAAHRDEAEQRQQRQRHPPEPDQQQDSGQRRGAQRFRARHQPAPRDAVGEQTGRDREQDERQRQRGLQQAGLAFADAEQQHRDDGGRGQRDLLGRLRGEVGPGQAVEGRGQVRRVGGGHDVIP